MASPVDFLGRTRLIQSIEQVHESGFSPERLCRVLEAQCRNGGIALPAAALSPRPDRYARRRIHLCDRWAYELIAMTWGPGQSSPLHDHDGQWCVECLWQGSLEITRHDLCERHLDGRIRFVTHAPTLTHAGEGDWLDAETGYHTMRNPSAENAAISLHIYPRAFRQCGWYEPAGEGWVRRHDCNLSLDPWD
ncbi:cysteine dioxygenase family protein [Xanthomonadaceae bacterium JHOS43]|nr:cysteine dioxygenase family protein [Xanthomonadaceae bacterium JHOS43]